MKSIPKSTKQIISIASLILAAGLIIGGAVSFLFSRTDEAANTFVIGNIDITLTESENLDFHMEANKSLKKDPVVTVKADSIDSYLFVEIEEKNNLDTFISYELEDGWLPLGDSYPNIYYRETEKSSKDETFHVLKDDKITVKDVSNTQMNALTDTTLPKLTFEAFAVQKAETGNAVEAWALITEQYTPVSEE